MHAPCEPPRPCPARHGRWVAIDPKPMRGDPAYDLWPLLEQIDPPFRAAHPARVLRERIALLADHTGLDAPRIAGWALARSVESALWRWDELGDLAGAQRELDRSAGWATLS